MTEPVHVAVCGLGWWGGKIVRNCAKHKGIGRLVGCDPDPARREQMAREFFIPVYENLEQALGKETLHAAFVITPPATHYDVIRLALSKGLHVAVAKPPTVKVSELKRLIRLAARRKRVLMTDATFCYSPACGRLRQALVDGEAGEIRYVESCRFGDNLRVQGLGRLQNAMAATGTNVIRDLVFHDLAVLNYLFRQDMRVKAVSVSHALFENLCDTAHVLLDMSGVPVHLAMSWIKTERKRQLTVHGTKAILVWDDLAPEKKLWKLELRDQKEWVYALETVEPLYAMVDHFLNTMASGGEAATGPAVMLPAMETLKKVEDLSGEK